MTTVELNSLDPCTGAVVWRGRESEVEDAVGRARGAFRGWSRVPLAERIAILRAFQAVVSDRLDDFAVLISRETGKPLWETKGEVQTCIAKVDISITAQAERAGERIGGTPGVRQTLRHKPHGVLGVLGPYNFPAHLPNGHIVPALLAGNTIVFKPSEKTPATAEFLRSCWTVAGLPDDVLVVAHGGADIGRALAAHEDIDGVLFTGSARAGAALHKAFADRPHSILAIEAGGNNPLVLWDVPDRALDAAAATILQSAFLTAGQRCTCARRLILQDSLADRLLNRLAGLIDRLVIGAPFDDPQPFMGPVIDEGAAIALEQGYAALIAAGGLALRAPTRPIRDRPFLTPALADVTGVVTADEELFGPILQVRRVARFDEAMTEANATRFGLAAALLGGDAALYERFWTESRAGIVNWNRPTNGAASSAPFGGVGASGNHRPSAYYAADYCAWPVASMATDAIQDPVTIGLHA